MAWREGGQDSSDPRKCLLPGRGLFVQMDMGMGEVSPVVQQVKNPPAMQEMRLARSPGGGHGNPLHYSCLDNPKDRGAWWATVHGVTESDVTEAAERGIPELWDTTVSGHGEEAGDGPCFREHRKACSPWASPLFIAAFLEPVSASLGKGHINQTKDWPSWTGTLTRMPGTCFTHNRQMPKATCRDGGRQKIGA